MTTHPRIIFIVVLALALYVPLGGWGVFVLIQQKADAALIAVLSGFVGTALGGLMSILNNTRTQPGEPLQAQITTPATNPVHTTDK